MVFITRFWITLKAFSALTRAAWSRMFFAMALTLGLSAALPTAAQTISAESFRLQKSDEGVFVNATLRFDLPLAIEDALMKGIPVVFSVQTDVMKERWYWYDKVLTQAQRNMRLSYQPLTRRWRLQTYSSSGAADATLSQTHETLSSALSAIKSVHRLKVAEWSDLEIDKRYTLEFRFKLDTHQLPRLFQIGAGNASDWNMTYSSSVRWVHDGKTDGSR
jgi:Domain of unknown function (DUF4390)